MRRSRLVTVLGAALVVALLLPSAAMAAPYGAAAPAPATAAPTVAAAPAIKLACALVIPVPASPTPRIVCRWSAFDGAAVARYRVWRRVDWGAAQQVAMVAPTAPLRYADFAIRPGHTYTYRIVAVAANGTRLGASASVSVRVGPAPEVLRFNCFYKVDATVKGVACWWAASSRPAAVRYVLYRSVNGAAREAVYRTPLSGRRSFLDKDVSSGQSIRYAVVAYSSTGRVVGLSRVDTVLVP